MRLEVKTKAGSFYILDQEAMTWQRESASYRLRSRDGKLLEWPNVKVGFPMELWCPPFRKGAAIRLIFTTPVVEVKEL